MNDHQTQTMNLFLDLHRAALITQQSLVAKLTMKYQIDFPDISTGN